jgi:hypothetical protein
MPRFLEPNQKFSIVLDSDKDKPVESRPTFFAKSLSMREQTKLGGELDQAWGLGTTEAIFEATCEMLKGYIVGWQNMGSFEFGCDVQEFLSFDEAKELLRKVLANQHVTNEEKKS